MEEQFVKTRLHHEIFGRNGEPHSVDPNQRGLFSPLPSWGSPRVFSGRFSKLDKKAGLKPAYFDFSTSIFNVQIHVLTTTGDALMGNIKHEIASELKLKVADKMAMIPNNKVY
jgi:hypothetical protein